MGNNTWSASSEDNKRLFFDRISFDLSENIHLHYRDLRIVFSKKEWLILIGFVNNANIWKNKYPEYEEGLVGTYSEIGEKIRSKSDYFDGRISLEEQIDGQFHFHFHDFRFEFTREAKEVLSNLFLESRRKSYLIKELSVLVYNGSVWNEVPIEQSPIYVGLFDEYASHDNYMNLLIRKIPSDPNLVTTEQYQELRKNIISRGFDFDAKPRVSIQGLTIREGHHRVSILLSLYGPDKRLLFDDDKLVGMV